MGSTIEQNAPDLEAPYPGPRPFARNEQNLFFGRSREISDLLNLILTYRVVVLHSHSGAGKTSLIQAGLLPAIEAEGAVVLNARVGGQILPRAREDKVDNVFAYSVLSSDWAVTSPGRLPSMPIIDGLPAPTADITLLVIDQFEELFTARPERWRERDGFFFQLQHLLQVRDDARILFATREDYLAELNPYSHFWVDGFRIRYRVERLSAESAVEAIERPAELKGLTIDPAAAKKLITDLQRNRVQKPTGTIEIAGEHIEPLHLQVICGSMWQKIALRPGLKHIGVEDIESVTDVDAALAKYYDVAIGQTVVAAKVSEVRLRRWFESEVITPAETRGLVFEGADLTGSVPTVAVAILLKHYIVRSELRAGARWVELTHDRFIGPIRQSNRSWFATRRRRRWLPALIACFVLLAGVLVAVYSSYRNHRNVLYARRALSDFEAAQGSAAAEKWADAIRGFQDARELYARLGNSFQEAQTLGEIAKAYRAQNANHEAQMAWLQAAQLYRRVNSKPAWAQALVQVGITDLNLDDPKSASAAFDDALKASGVDTIMAIETTISESHAINGPHSNELTDAVKVFLQKERIRLLKSLLGKQDLDESARAYICGHNLHLVGATDYKSNPGRIQKLVDNFKLRFPLAAPGSVQSDGKVPIVVAWFLTCEEAKTLSAVLVNSPGGYIFIFAQNEGCLKCAGLRMAAPGTAAEKSPTKADRKPNPRLNKRTAPTIDQKVKNKKNRPA